MTNPLIPLAAGPALGVSFRQGQILAFNSATLENTVDVGGAILVDLPLLGVGEADSYGPGVNVGILVMTGTKGTSTYAILGQLVNPNTAAATHAISRLARSIGTDFVAATESTTSVPFTDLATIGPQVSLTVKASGKVLVFLGATIAVGAAAGALWGGFMNFFMSGANTSVVGQPGGLGYSTSGAPSVGGPNLEFSIARMIPVSGLTPGATTFTAKYSIDFGASGETAQFRNRSMAVFAL